MNDAEYELHALLVRAATLEAQRQAAQQARDVEAQSGLEAELHALWARYTALERASAA